MGTALRVVLVVTALLMLTGIYAVQWVQGRLLEAGVQRLQWEGVRLSGRELSVGAVTGLYSAEQGDLEFAARDVRLVFVWDGGPRFQLIDLGDLDLEWEPGPVPAIDPMLLPDPSALEPAEPGAGQTPAERELPDPHDWFSFIEYLPAQARVHRLRVEVPCQAARCELLGDLSLARLSEPERVTAELGLLTGTERLDWWLELGHRPDRLDLASRLELADAEALRLASVWQGREESWHWEGDLTVPAWAGHDWVFDFVRPWLPAELPLPRTLPVGLSASARWALTPGREPRVAGDLVAGDVTLAARGELAEPWTLADVGRVQGQMALSVEGRAGHWRLHQGEAGVRLEQPSLPALEAVPASLRPTAVQLALKPEPDSALDWQAVLPLGLHAELEGPLRGTLAVRLMLSSVPDWTAQFEQGQLELTAPRLTEGDLALSALRVRLPFSGRLNGQQLDLRLGQAALVTAGRVGLQQPDLELTEVRLALPGLTARVPFDRPQAASLKSRVQLGASRVEHASLVPQGWSLNGEARRTDDGGLGFDGSLASLGGLGLDLGFAWPYARPWRAELRLQDIFLRAANPLAATLADWPPLLSLATGRITGRFELFGNPDLQRVDGRIDATGLAGIHDRLAFEGLTVPLGVRLREDALTLELEGLRLTALDPGLPLGPAALRGRYQSTLQTPAEGRLEIAEANLDLLGGRLRLEPATLDFSESSQALVVGMQGVQLSRLFEVYPAEGLAGQGILDGRMPVRLQDGQISIDAGRVQAREPGGVLQYRSDKLRELGRTNPGMRELALALDDFRYTVLSSDLDYGEDGVLILGLRLEGSNPELQRGRPVHLNVRLEEDIPALLASLQLSGQVSDIIQRRVQERLLQRRLGP